MSSNFERVSEMNTAFGNPKADTQAVSLNRLRKQCSNIPDEVGELFIALGGDPNQIKAIVDNLKLTLRYPTNPVNVDQVRDSLCDIHVFAYGAHHFMGINADQDMDDVVDGVMTRFIKDEADLEATTEKHAAKGVTDVYLEGNYPTAVLKSAKDQPDAPQGKFLKSASYKDTVFVPVDVNFVD